MTTSRRFNFRLERIRALREQLEGISREQLAASLGRRLTVEAELRDALEAVDGAHDAQLRAVAGERVTGHDLVAANAYLERTTRKRELAAERLRQRDVEVEQRRAQLTAASRDRKTLERLKDRARRKHRLEAERREGAALDEVAISMHRRKVA